MKDKIFRECPVTGREVIDSEGSPQSRIRGKLFYFCCRTCKGIFDRYLVKYAKKQFAAYTVQLQPVRPKY